MVRGPYKSAFRVTHSPAFAAREELLAEMKACLRAAGVSIGSAPKKGRFLHLLGLAEDAGLEFAVELRPVDDVADEVQGKRTEVR